MNLADAQKFKYFHFKTKTGINKKKNLEKKDDKKAETCKILDEQNYNNNNNIKNYNQDEEGEDW